ncbi:MAG: hypothetical protein ABSD11_17290, partial [Methylocella sp.]
MKTLKIRPAPRGAGKGRFRRRTSIYGFAADDASWMAQVASIGLGSLSQRHSRSKLRLRLAFAHQDG